MAQDLPSFLERVRAERPDEFVTVSREMDPGHEVTAAVVKIEKEAKRRPVLLFENVKGSAWPVLTNLHASRSRLAMAMNAPPREMLRKYLKAMDEPVAPREVNTGPCKDVVLKGADIDLALLPQLEHHQGDGGAYITAAISFAKDPESEMWNCAYNRLMITGRDTTSIHLTLG
ncbi:MAG: UbiD family decarboxylase, partial [Defluviicoccus sp.]|nr:UbiD family decarboxylase [Defluviicoccus sp.]